jgi:hypothetical protein
LHFVNHVFSRIPLTGIVFVNCLAKVVVLIATIFLAFSSIHSASANNGIRAVALKGQQAPGLDSGITFRSFDTSAFALNNSGHAAFIGQLTGSVIGGSSFQSVWTEGGDGLLKLLARQGDGAAGVESGVTFSFFNSLSSPVLNDNGKAAFIATLTGTGITSANNVGIWSEGSGAFTLEARKGMQAPGTAPGVNFSNFYDNLSSSGVGLLLNNQGKIAFEAQLTGSGGNGIWSGGGGTSLTLVAREGSPAPGTTSFNTLSGENGPVMNQLGQSAFTATNGVWSEGGSGGLHLVAKSGTPAPGTPAGVNFATFSFHPALNDVGHIGFTAILTGSTVSGNNDRGVWADRGAGLELVARTGSPAPGTEAGVNFAVRFSERVMNSRGEMAFVSALAGTGINFSNDTGIWSEGGGLGLRLVARNGNQAPGTDAGVVFSTFQPVPENSPILNERGNVAFAASLTGTGITTANNYGLWTEITPGDLRLVVRKGAVLDVSNDPLNPDFRTVSGLGFTGRSGNQDSRRSAFNDLGQVAFWASFTDGSSGIFVSNTVAVPEPCSVVLVALAMSTVRTKRLSRSRIRPNAG